MKPDRLHFFILLLGIFVSCNVLAHAELLDTVPANGAVMEGFTGEFVVRFSEPVSIIRIQLLNQNREALELNQLRGINDELHFSTASPPGDGQYLLSFRVLSLDAHPVSGSVGFAIGNLPAPLPEFTEVDKTALVIARINRTIHLLSILASLGLVLFPLLFKFPDELEYHRRAYLNITGITGIATAVFALGLWGVLLRETTIATILEADTWSVAMSTSLGTSFALIISGLLGMLTANILDPNLPPGKFSGLLGVVLVVASFGASGHAASSGLMMVSVFVLHAAMAGIWFGALWLVYRTVMTEPVAMVTAVLGQFSTRSTWMVSILLICASILAWYQLGGIGQFIDSEYGNLLMLKIGLVTLVLILAALNRWKFTPAIGYGGKMARQRLLRSIYFEGLLIIAVLAVTVVLASTPPPGKALAASSRTLMLTAGERINLEMTITPARTGNNHVEMKFTQDDALISPMEVDLYWQQTEAGIEPLSQAASKSGGGVFEIDNIGLLMEGNWQFRVEALIDDFTRERFETNISIEQ